MGSLHPLAHAPIAFALHHSQAPPLHSPEILGEKHPLLSSLLSYVKNACLTLARHPPLHSSSQAPIDFLRLNTIKVP